MLSSTVNWNLAENSVSILFVGDGLPVPLHSSLFTASPNPFGKFFRLLREAKRLPYAPTAGQIPICPMIKKPISIQMYFFESCDSMKKYLRPLSYVLTALAAAGLTLMITQGVRRDSKLEELEKLITEKFIAESDPVKMEDAAAYAMVAALDDRWSYYLPASEYETHMERMNNAYVGIGITITQEDGGMRVREVSAGGPAEEAGILAEDLITAVDGTGIQGFSTAETRELVRGREGTQVVITLERDGQTLEKTLTRRRYEIPVATAEMLTGNMGLVTIENFDARCASETRQAVESLLEQGAQALIFDVRNNPGGYASELVEVLDMLLPEGEIFRTVDYSGKEKADYSDPECIDVPMAVLVNENSFSAAEFFAAALQEYEKAVIVGQQTVGKGYFQTTFRLSDGSAVGLSIGEYFTPKGRNLAGVGVTPDLPVPVEEETASLIYYNSLPPEEDPQIQAARECLK